MPEMSGWRFIAIILGIAASALIVLAVAVFYGYLPPSQVGNLTSGELGTFGFLAIVGAVGCEVASRRR